MGWSDADVTGSDGCTKSKDERASFIQTWLFFGLLSTIFGTHFSQDDWITHIDVDHPVIETRNIGDRLKELELTWATTNTPSSISGLGAPRLAGEAGREQTVLMQVNDWLVDFSYYPQWTTYGVRLLALF
jgi:hypothetical protein